MNYKIISLTAKDISEASVLSSKMLKEDFPEYSPKVATIYGEKYFSKKHLRDMLKHKTNHMYGIKNNNGLIAFIVLKGDFGGVLYIELLLVKREYRRQGIGNALLNMAVKWALHHKYHYLWLFTESSKNIDFYTHNGFTYIGLHKGAWFGADEHILSKQLRNEPFPEVFTNYSKYF